MASPHVAGAAALAWNYNSGSSIADVRNAILYGADYKPSLTNIQSASRLNLLGMLKALIKPTITSKSITFSGTNTAILNFHTDVFSRGQLSYSSDSGAWTNVPIYTIKNPTTPFV